LGEEQGTWTGVLCLEVLMGALSPADKCCLQPIRVWPTCVGALSDSRALCGYPTQWVSPTTQAVSGWFLNIRWWGEGLEDRERWIEIKKISRDRILGPHPLVVPDWLATNVIGKWCFQKILVLAFQMEESKQNTWMGWGRIASLKKGESPVLPGKEIRRRAGKFLYHLELGGGELICPCLGPLICGLGGRALEPRGGAITDYA
jgi:hypothetical protein